MCNEVYENKQNELVILAYKVIQVRLKHWEVKWGEKRHEYCFTSEL